MAELPTVERLYSIRKDGSHKAMHPADVRGPWMTRRRIGFAVLIAIYVGIPLIQIGGHSAIFLDIPGRHFYLFGAAFNAQDTPIGLFLLAMFAFGLLFVTAWLGRVWCGFACPQSVFLEGVFRPIERFFDGPAERRIRLETAPWTAGRVARFIGKHVTYLAIAALLAHIALGFFVPPRALLALIADGPLEHLGLFVAMVAVTGLVYFNFMWFREQLCLIICPYGRLQSALIDRDSLIVGYDKTRGEPRGKKSDTGRGACVDCHRCVAVCPTGIDIRNGLQMECVGCTQCIDACDEIMDKVGQPRGLIRFDSQHGLDGKPRRVIRARLFVYGGIVVAALIGIIVTLTLRTPFEANLLRQQAAPYRLTDDAIINSFEIHLINKHPVDDVFTISAKLPDGTTMVLPQPRFALTPLGSGRVPIVITSPRANFHAGASIPIDIYDSVSNSHKTIVAHLLGPTAR